MGADGTGIFQNDDAMDFIGDLAEVPNDARTELRERLESVAAMPAEEYLEVPEGSEALAAAAIVSAARDGSPVDRSHPSVDEYLTKITPHVPDDLAPIAIAAIDRVFSGESELMGLWDDEGLLDEARAEPMAVREHLAR